MQDNRITGRRLPRRRPVWLTVEVLLDAVGEVLIDFLQDWQERVYVVVVGLEGLVGAGRLGHQGKGNLVGPLFV